LIERRGNDDFQTRPVANENPRRPAPARLGSGACRCGTLFAGQRARFRPTVLKTLSFGAEEAANQQLANRAAQNPPVSRKTGVNSTHPLIPKVHFVSLEVFRGHPLFIPQTRLYLHPSRCAVPKAKTLWKPVLICGLFHRLGTATFA
jgi:hypothetical protein